MRQAAVAEVLEILRQGDLTKLIGIAEDDHIEAKSEPYRLESGKSELTPTAKIELAKDCRPSGIVTVVSSSFQPERGRL